jgi:hypothetical protein
MAAWVISSITIAGCTTPPGTQTRNTASAGPASAVSWDGTYRVSVQITGAGIRCAKAAVRDHGGDRVSSDQQCSLLPHAASERTREPPAGHAPTIAAEGIFQSILHNGRMTGRVVSARISGPIDGYGCIYSFSLEPT